MAEIVEIEIVMDDGSIRKGFAKVQGAGTDAAKAIEQQLDRVTGQVRKVFTLLAGAFTIKKIIEAGEESERAWRGFALALASTNQLNDQNLKSFEETANSLQKLTGVQDEVIAKGGQLLLNLGRLSADALPRVTKATLDLAAAVPSIGGPEGAFNLMSKAASGSTAVLSRYGIRIDQTLKPQEQFAQLLKVIETNFHGMAVASNMTFEGMRHFVELGFGEVVKQLGLIVTKSPAAIAAMKFIGDEFIKLSEKISKIGGGKDPLRPLILGLLEFSHVLTTQVLPPFEMLYNVGVIVFKDFLAGLNGIAAAIGIVGQGTIMLLQSLGVEIDTKLINSINNFVEKGTEGVFFWTQSAEDAMLKIDQTPMSTSMNEFLLKMDEVIAKSSEMQTSYSQNLTNMGGSTSAFTDDAIAKLKALNEAITRTIVRGISGAVQSMVKNLQAGKGAFDNFGTLIMNLIGDVAIQIGEFFVLTGIGLIALISNPITAGFTTVAMGLALIAFGALMKSMSGGGANVPDVGGGIAGGGVSSEPNQVPETQIQEEKPITQVAINIQGDVLDSRETGLRIAEIINDNFDLNGTKLVTGVG